MSLTRREALRVVRAGMKAGVIVRACSCTPKVTNDPEHICPIDADRPGFVDFLMRLKEKA